jgi:hypothetical protein
MTLASLAAAVAVFAASAQDARQILYVSTLNFQSGQGTIVEYRAYGAHKAPIRTITLPAGQAEGLWADSRGDLYAAIVNAGVNGQGFVYVYRPGATSPYRIYSKGIDGPSGVAFDSAGDMYVANLCGPPGQGSDGCFVFARPYGPAAASRTASPFGDTNGYVAVFPKGSKQPAALLEGPLHIAEGVAVDDKGDVFVANFIDLLKEASNIVEFPAGSTDGKVLAMRGLMNTIVYQLLFDRSGELLLADNDVLFYPPPFRKPSGVLSNGVSVAIGLAYGPDGTLFVGNYLVTENDGDAVAFPPGDTSPARTYSVPNGDAVMGVAVGPAT